MPQTKFQLAEETLGYQTSSDPSNTDKRLLVAGSQNVLIDYQRKVVTRGGYTRLGAGNAALTETRNAWTWNTSTGTELPQRFYDDELEAYLSTVDGVAINAYIRIRNAWSTTAMLRADTIFNATENLDEQYMVNGDDNLYRWNGAVAVVASVTSVTITKTGSTTFAGNRFYTAGNKTVVCVRTGGEYTYTGGEGTLTLTGISDTAGLIAGDILVQKVVTATDKPVSNRINDTIFSYQNHITLGSYTDELTYGSADDDGTDFAFSSPRLTGEGFKFQMTDPSHAINSLGKYLVHFAGRSTIYKMAFTDITVGTTLSESIEVTRLDAGIDQGALNHECVIQIGNSLAYLSNEVALRTISNPEDLTGIDPQTLSNPIKPDFDAEDWTGAFMYWFKNIIFITARASSHAYMLNYQEDANGKLKRYWNPPQVLPIGPLSVIDIDTPRLYGHSNSVPETYLLFDGLSDGQYEGMDMSEKLPIHAKAISALDNSGARAVLKNFDEYYVEGQITENTNDLVLGLNYDFQGATQYLERIVDGSDEDILEGVVGYNSLAQASLGTNPLAGILNTPSDARKFRVVFEYAKEDYHELQAIFETNEVDRYWAIIAHGPNTMFSPRRNTTIRK